MVTLSSYSGMKHGLPLYRRFCILWCCCRIAFYEGLKFIVLLYQVCPTRECERQSGASWSKERGTNKDKEINNILWQKRERDPERSWLMVTLCSQISQDLDLIFHLFYCCQHCYQYCINHIKVVRLCNTCPAILTCTIVTMVINIFLIL